MPKTKHAPLTDDQIQALRTYADEHGKGWKDSLNLDWMRGATWGALTQLRNTHGPAWLAGFELEGGAE